MSTETKRRSGAWYLLPIFLTIIGGVIAYFVIRDDDPKKAKNCLYLGIILAAIGIGFSVVSGMMLASEMENSPFIEDFKNSDNVDYASPSEMIISDKSQINKLAENVDYEYNAHGLKVNHIQLQDEGGNVVTTVDRHSSYQIASEVENQDDVEKTLIYDIFVSDDNGNQSGFGGETVITSYGTVLIDGGWQTMSPGTYEIEIHLADKNSDADLDFHPFWRVMHLE